MRARRLAAAAGVLVTCAALVAIGRWEGTRHVDREERGLRHVLALVGPLGGPTLDAYRVSLVPFDCLLYRRGDNPYALEVCVDTDGRVIEAFDRRGSLKYWSLREDPTASTVRVSRAEFDRLLRRLGVPTGINQGPRGQ